MDTFLQRFQLTRGPGLVLVGLYFVYLSSATGVTKMLMGLAGVDEKHVDLGIFHRGGGGHDEGTAVAKPLLGL